jgi:acyl-CoA reductase-like NAD-dependent aldehyde dehydrogenase
MAKPPAPDDRDLAPIAEARALARRAKQAWLELAEFSQERIDAIVDAMAAAATPQAEAFARLAVEETGYGVVEDKIQKNLFSSQKVYQFIRPMKTVGVVARTRTARHRDRRAVRRRRRRRAVDEPDVDRHLQDPDLAEGALHDRLSPHPAAVKCITRVAEVMDEAARRAGAPAGAINWMTTVTLEGRRS